MATDRFVGATGRRRPISYPDPTGDAAASHVDHERASRLYRPADIGALRDIYDTAPGVRRAYADRPLTNAHCVAALIAARIHTPASMDLLLADAHTADKESTWTPSDHTPPSWTSWWDSDSRTSAA